ncbi:MAG: haloacid dehalogenase-like hydrolase [Cetobacterium sp.]
MMNYTTRKMKENVMVLTDLDGTLTKKSLVLEHCGFLEANKVIDTFGAYENWKTDMKNEKLIVECAIAYQQAITGKRLEDLKIDTFCKNFLNNEENWYDTILELEGRNSLIISGSADFLVQALCKEIRSHQQFEMVNGQGSIYELKDGVVTGKIIKPMFSADIKREVIQNVINEDMYIIGLGDTSSDFPIFEVSDYSILVEPTNETLHKIIEKNIKIDRIF